MPKKPQQLAKLSRPRLHRAVARERLFALLDDARSHKPAICVVGPPGAGKTTLVASWLDSRRIPALWYEIDAGDSDLATFFLYLRQAAVTFCIGGGSLPALTREHPRDVSAFARRFFRGLFEAAPSGGVLVLDNFQEAGQGSLLEKLLGSLIEEVPRGSTIVIISRFDVPQSCARLAASEDMMAVDAEELRFTVEETQAFLATRGAKAVELAASIQQLSEGWPAGMTLMVESLKYLDSLESGPQIAARGALFAYFAEQVFDRIPVQVRKLLLRTALFPRFTAEMARKLSGIADPAPLLDQLCRRRLFISGRATLPPTYQYHALFREFLRARLEEELSGAQLSIIQRQTADLLAAAGHMQEAFALYVAAGQWGEATRLLAREAEALLDQGRWRTLLDAMETLPSKSQSDDPWLQYWRGMALISVDLGAARWVLETACAEFVRRKDSVGVCLAAAGLLDRCFYEYADFRQGDVWLDLLCNNLTHVARFPSPSSELEACGAALIGLLFRRPADPMLRLCVERIDSLREEKLNANRLLMTDLYLITYASFAADLVRAKKVAARIATLIAEPEVSEINRYHAFDWLAYLAMIRGDHPEAATLLRRARAVSEDSGQTSLEVDLLLTEINSAVQRDARLEADRLMERMETVVSTKRPIDQLFCQLARTRVRLALGDRTGAVRAGHLAISFSDGVGVTAWQAISRLWTACALLEDGGGDEARKLVEQGKQLVQGTCLVQSEVCLDALRIALDLRQGDRVSARKELRRLLGFARDRVCGEILCRLHQIMPELCAEALDADIEAAYVRDLIRRFDWPPPPGRFDSWPWPIRIVTFGGFAIELNGEPVEFSGKAPRKVLALLKALIAFGGERVPRQQLIDTLWVQTEGDASEAALDVAIVRLRKLLNRQDAVIVHNEQVSLNRRCCWVDRFALEQLDSMHTDIADSVGRLLSLYRGEFLPADHDASWCVRPRLRLRALFCRQVTGTGAALESREAWSDAIRLYERGLVADDLVEEFYQGLMRCHLALGRFAEGMGVFRRLRQTLSVVLGVAPSPSSEALARHVQASRPASQQRD